MDTWILGYIHGYLVTGYMVRWLHGYIDKRLESYNDESGFN